MVKVGFLYDPHPQALFCGDIEGHVQEALARVTKVNASKAGPFDVLFCVGRFLDEENSIQIGFGLHSH